MRQNIYETVWGKLNGKICNDKGEFGWERKAPPPAWPETKVDGRSTGGWPKRPS